MAYVQAAKARHINSINIPPPRERYAEPVGLDRASQRASIVVANLVKQVITHDTYDIYTWSKFRIVERLGSYVTVRNDIDMPAAIPAVLLPVLANEFIMVEPTGVIQLEGVNVSSVDPSVETLPLSEPRLMFLQFSAGGSLAAPVFGHLGVFSVMPNGHFRPASSEKGNVLKEDLDSKAHGRVDELRAILRQR